MDKLEEKLSRLIVLTENALTATLILKGVGQQEIRRIVGVDLRKITRISKELTKAKTKGWGKNGA